MFYSWTQHRFDGFCYGRAIPYVAQRQTTVPGGSIDQAAHLAGKSRTDFMLEAACEKAQRVLLDRTVFALDAAGIQRFTERLDAPLD